MLTTSVTPMKASGLRHNDMKSSHATMKKRSMSPKVEPAVDIPIITAVMCGFAAWESPNSFRIRIARSIFRNLELTCCWLVIDVKDVVESERTTKMSRIQIAVIHASTNV